MPLDALPPLPLEVTAGLRDALHASATLLHHGISDDPAPLPASVDAVRVKYERMVEARTVIPLTLYAAALRTEEYVPRAQLFEAATLLDDGLPLCRAVRAPALFNPTYACLATELDSFFEDVQADTGVAVWSTFILPAFGGLRHDEFLLLGLVRDVAGQEAVFLGSPSGIRWLAVEGDELADLVSSALLVGSAAIFHVLNESLRKALRQSTVTQLSVAQHALAAPLLTVEQAERAAAQLWDRTSPASRVIEAYFVDATQLVFSESMELLNELVGLFRRWPEQLEEAMEASQKQAAQAKKRAAKDLERLQVAYTGLKARADRQDQLIRELRRTSAVAPSVAQPTQSGPSSDQAFSQALRGLFGSP